MVPQQLLRAGRRGAVAASVAATIVVPASFAWNTASAGGCTAKPGTWSTVSTPSGSSWSGPVSDPLAQREPYFATDPSSRSVLVTDAMGQTIYRSTNGGCSWTNVFSIAAGSSNTGLFTVVPDYGVSALTAPQSGLAASKQYVYAAIVDRSTTGAAMPIYIAVSTNDGKSFSIVSSATTAPRCTDVNLAVAPSQPKTLYVDCQEYAYPNTSGDVLFASHDEGATWTQPTAKDFPATTSHAAQAGLAVDPTSPSTLWAVGRVNVTTPYISVFKSKDSGASWAPTSLHADKFANANIPAEAVALAFGRVAHKPAAMAAWSAAGIYQSLNDGKTWGKPLSVPNANSSDVVGVAYGATPSVLYVLTASPALGTRGVHSDPGGCYDQHTSYAGFAYDNKRHKWRPLGSAPLSGAGRMSQFASDSAAKSAVYALVTKQTNTVKANQGLCTYTTSLVRYQSQV